MVTGESGLLEEPELGPVQVLLTSQEDPMNLRQLTVSSILDRFR